jgi:uncharacterized coiled-coil protein SlyX
MEKITKTYSVIKDVPSDLIEKAGDMPQKLPEGGLWAYATVEVPDTSGDIVRVDGIDYSAYHNPPSTKLKILAQHIKVLPDGTPPVIGRVEAFVKTVTKTGEKALAFYMTWATQKVKKVSEDGVESEVEEVTPLARSYKNLFDTGYLDSFSIGAGVIERESIKNAGWDYKATSLAEISAVTVPANSKANVIRALEDELGEHLDKVAVLETKIVDQESVIKSLTEKVEGACKQNIDVESRLVTALDKKLDALNERLDFLEASIVAKSDPTPMTGDRTGGVRLQEELKGIAQQLHNVRESFSGKRK